MKSTTTGAPSDSWRDTGAVELTPILAGALAAFSELGYHGTTVRDIANRVGVTVPALYYHHSNKEGMLLALLLLATEDCAWRVEAAAGEADGDVRQSLRNIVEAIVNHMTYRRELAVLDHEARYLGPAERERYVVPRRRIEDVFTAVVHRGVEQGVFATPQPREAARGLLGMLQWITRWYRRDGDLEPSQIATRYADLALVLVESR